MSNYDQGYVQDVNDIDLSTELKKYKSKRIQLKGDPKLHDQVVKRLPKSCQVVDRDADIVVVVAMKVTRVESDAEETLLLAEVNKGDRDKTILVMFHNDNTSQPSKCVSYTCDAVYKTFHEPLDPQRIKLSNFVWPVCKVTLVIMVGFIGAGFGWYLRCSFDFPACIP